VRAKKPIGRNRGGRSVARIARSMRNARRVAFFLDRIAPRACASVAAAAFRRPVRAHPTRSERDTLRRAASVRVSGRAGEIAVWHWGSGPRVLLVHGWGGHAGRLSAFVAPLLDAGFGVTAFDAPGHGRSAGRLCSLPDFVEAITAIASAWEPAAIVGHSMGAAAAALAIAAGLPARAAVLIATPADPERYTMRFARCLRLSAATTAAMKGILRRRYGLEWSDLLLATHPPSVPVFLAHDRRDPRVPFRDSLLLTRSWPRAEILERRGTGHHRIIRDPEVIRESVAFLRRHAADAPAWRAHRLAV
jgi:pimeloyl-ACP methyl ester carboxylesterase